VPARWNAYRHEYQTSLWDLPYGSTTPPQMRIGLFHQGYRLEADYY